MYGYWSAVLTLTLCVTASHSADVLSTLDGDQIVTLMQTFGDKCPPPPNNQSWAPIPESIACGAVPRCEFPKEWCAYKPAADGTPDLETLTCIALADECRQAFETANNEGSLVAPPHGSTIAPEGSSPPPEGGSTPSGGGSEGSPTPGGEGGSPTPGVEGSSPMPVEGSPTPGGEASPTPEGGMSSPAPPPPPEGSSPPPEGSPTPAAGPTSATTIIPPFGECCDYHEFCCFWASLGQCDANKLFMVQLCQSSCGTCGCSKDTINDCSINVAGACASGNVTATAVCACKSTDLINRDWHKNCATWTADGGCEKNAQFLKPMCKKSCNSCS